MQQMYTAWKVIVLSQVYNNNTNTYIFFLQVDKRYEKRCSVEIGYRLFMILT